MEKKKEGGESDHFKVNGKQVRFMQVLPNDSNSKVARLIINRNMEKDELQFIEC